MAVRVISSDEAKLFATTANELVEDLVHMIAEKNPVFSKYKVQVSGSTRENTRAGDPYEIDFLVLYEIDVDEVEEVLPGYVKIKPKVKEYDKFQEFINSQGQLLSNKLMFFFLSEAYKITAKDEKYKERKKRLIFGKVGGSKSSKRNTLENVCTTCVVHHSRTRLTVNNLRYHGIGAAVEFYVESPEIQYNTNYESLDVVLSFHFKNGYWPANSKGLERYKENIDEECFKCIIDHGVAVVCKAPDRPLVYESTDTLFRLSFSFVEAKLFDYATSKQREAYKMLKMIKKVEIDNLNSQYSPEVSLSDLLNKRLVSYHLKTIFFFVVYSSSSPEERKEEEDEEYCTRKWLVLYLEKLIDCLHHKSIKHFFIDGFELLDQDSLDKDLNEKLLERETFKFPKPNSSLEEYKSKYFSEFLGYNGNEIDACKILEAAFIKALNGLPEDLSTLRTKCSYKRFIPALPP